MQMDVGILDGLLDGFLNIFRMFLQVFDGLLDVFVATQRKVNEIREKIKVTMVEVKQVDLPEQMIRAIARQAEAERERWAKIIHAEGEAAAAANLEKAAETMARQPGAIQLRYLQTLVEIGSEKNTTVVFPLPMDLLSSLGQVLKKLAGPEPGGYRIVP